jgi:hypothetical protein
MSTLEILSLVDGEAKEKGLRAGDILISYDFNIIDSSSALSKIMEKYAGQTHKMIFVRENQVIESDIKAGSLGIKVVISDLMLDIEGINRRKKIESDDLLITSIKVSTTHIIPGYSIVDNIDVISAEVVEGMGVVFDWVSDWADMLGGRSQHTESILPESVTSPAVAAPSTEDDLAL